MQSYHSNLMCNLRGIRLFFLPPTNMTRSFQLYYYDDQTDSIRCRELRLTSIAAPADDQQVPTLTQNSHHHLQSAGEKVTFTE